MPDTEINDRFPGRANYVGPTTGMFGLLHHTLLCEFSWNVMERVKYVVEEKDPHEIPTRLHNMIYLGDCEAAIKYHENEKVYRTKTAELDSGYWDNRCTLESYETLGERTAKLSPLLAEYRRQRDALDAERLGVIATTNGPILEFIKQHIPNTAWNGKELVFPAVIEVATE